MYNSASRTVRSSSEESQKPEKKISKVAIFFMSCMALGLGYIILKEVSLPPWVMAIGAIGGGITILILGVSRPEVITYVLIAYLPFSKVLDGNFGGAAMALNLTNILMIFIILAWITGKYADGEPLWRSTPMNFAIIAFALLGLLSVIRGNYYDATYAWFALIDYKRWVTPIMMFFLVLNTVKSRESIRNIVIVIIVVTTVVGLMAIYDYISVGDTSLEKSRIGGIATHSNTLAAFFNYYIFLPFGFFLMNMHRPKCWLLLIPFLIMFRELW